MVRKRCQEPFFFSSSLIRRKRVPDTVSPPPSVMKIWNDMFESESVCRILPLSEVPKRKFRLQ